jgi:hypothetical protein
MRLLPILQWYYLSFFRWQSAYQISGSPGHVPPCPSLPLFFCLVLILSQGTERGHNKKWLPFETEYFTIHMNIYSYINYVFIRIQEERV